MDDIITSLFNIDCDEALQKIFLYLDAHSLKACRQVVFIKLSIIVWICLN